jgi:Uma2 family endonuclease
MATITNTEKLQSKKKNAQKILDDLVYEIIDGNKIYYQSYRDVLNGKKAKEEIMGSSTLQMILINYIIRIFIKGLDEKLYYIATNEAGIHISEKTNFSTDIAIYPKSILTPDKINTQYADVPPQLVIEIDIKADVDKSADYLYVHHKTQKLLDFGVEKVIWIFTSTQKVFTATQNEPWLTVNWDKDIELMHGLLFNIAQYLKEEGIHL